MEYIDGVEFVVVVVVEGVVVELEGVVVVDDSMLKDSMLKKGFFVCCLWMSELVEREVEELFRR